MASYPFPPVKRKVYPKTFLKDVRLFVKFERRDFEKVDKEAIRDFFSSFKGAGLDGSTLPDGIQVMTEDECIKLNFTLESFFVVVRQKLYKSFETIMQFLGAAKEYCRILNVDGIVSLSVTKFNELNFQLSAPDFPIEKVMEGVYSPDLLSEIVIDTSFAGLTRWEKGKTYEDLEESQTRFFIECGFTRKDDDVKKGSLTLKTRIETANRIVKPEELSSQAEELNKILDNAFHWCVLDSIIKKMEEV